VSEEEITDAILLLLERKKVIAEGAGATPLAAILGGHIQLPPGSRVALVISGGNIDTRLLDRIIGIGLQRTGRRMTAVFYLDDKPGALAGLLAIIAANRGNVLHIHHSRYWCDLPVGKIRVDVEIETRDMEHIRSIRKALDEAGYTPITNCP
jgi:threonine dehydratase